MAKPGIALAGAGVASAAYNAAWLAIGFFVIAGTVITLSKFFPRVAIEPVPNTRPGSHAHWRWRLTVNGTPIGERHATSGAHAAGRSQ